MTRDEVVVTTTTTISSGATKSVTDGPSNGFLYSGGQFTTLDVPGFSNTVLFGINNRGAMVGQVYNASQFGSQGILITTPEPATLFLLVVGLGALCVGTWKGRRGGRIA